MNKLSTLFTIALLATTASLQAGGGFDIRNPKANEIEDKKAKFRKRAQSFNANAQDKVEADQKLGILEILYPKGHNNNNNNNDYALREDLFNAYAEVQNQRAIRKILEDEKVGVNANHAAPRIKAEERDAIRTMLSPLELVSENGSIQYDKNKGTVRVLAKGDQNFVLYCDPMTFKKGDKICVPYKVNLEEGGFSVEIFSITQNRAVDSFEVPALDNPKSSQIVSGNLFYKLKADEIVGVIFRAPEYQPQSRFTVLAPVENGEQANNSPISAPQPLVKPVTKVAEKESSVVKPVNTPAVKDATTVKKFPAVEPKRNTGLQPVQEPTVSPKKVFAVGPKKSAGLGPKIGTAVSPKKGAGVMPRKPNTLSPINLGRELPPPPPPARNDNDNKDLEDLMVDVVVGSETPPPPPPYDDEPVVVVEPEVTSEPQKGGLLAEIGKVKLNKTEPNAIAKPKLNPYAEQITNRRIKQNLDEETHQGDDDDHEEITPVMVYEHDNSINGRLAHNREQLDGAQSRYQEMINVLSREAKDKFDEASQRKAEVELPGIKDRLVALRLARVQLLKDAIADCDARLAKKEVEMKDKPGTFAKKVKPALLNEKKSYKAQLDNEEDKIREDTKSDAERTKEARENKARRDAIFEKARAVNESKKSESSQEDTGSTEDDWK